MVPGYETRIPEPGCLGDLGKEQQAWQTSAMRSASQGDPGPLAALQLSNRPAETLAVVASAERELSKCLSLCCLPCLAVYPTNSIAKFCLDVFRLEVCRMYSVHGSCTLVSQKRQHFIGGGKGNTMGFGVRRQQLNSASDQPR